MWQQQRQKSGLYFLRTEIQVRVQTVWTRVTLDLLWMAAWCTMDLCVKWSGLPWMSERTEDRPSLCFTTVLNFKHFKCSFVAWLIFIFSRPELEINAFSHFSSPVVESHWCSVLWGGGHSGLMFLIRLERPVRELTLQLWSILEDCWTAWTYSWSEWSTESACWTKCWR